jgi:predicted secreted hydrolase
MRRIIISIFMLLALSFVGCAPMYTINHSVPTKPLSLPEDNAAHYWAQTEWWYYTGHLNAPDGREFGYELTFFKRLTNEDKLPGLFIPIPAYWVKDVGMVAHFAVTDLKNKKFKAQELDNILKKSKADEKKYDVMIDKWTAREENGKHILHAEMKGYQIDLELEPLKQAALHGKDGIVNKGGDHANYYYSYTKMKTSGVITVDGQPIKVSGQTWMDHEFGTMKFTPQQTGYDWFSVQLDNNCELMFYSMRNGENPIPGNGGGTFIGPDGKTIWFTREDVDIKSLSRWYSKDSDANYPASWEVTIKPLNIKLNIVPALAEQELNLKPIPYWEGSVIVTGTQDNAPVTGKGYIELVGYSKKYPIPLDK